MIEREFNVIYVAYMQAEKRKLVACLTVFIIYWLASNSFSKSFI